MADPDAITIGVVAAVVAPLSALVGGVSSFGISVWRERRQAKREEQEAKREFGAEVRALFQERVEALHSASERPHNRTRKKELRDRLASAEDEHFQFLDGLVQNDPDYFTYIRDRIRTEAERLPSDKDRAVPSETVEAFRGLASLANRASAAGTAAEGHFASGMAAYVSENYRQAVGDFSRAIENDSKQGRYFWRRGDAYDEIGRFEQAIADYNQALSLDKDNPDFLLYRGITLVNLGRYEEALADFDRAVQLRPDQASTLRNRGIVLRRLGRHEESLASLERALQLLPDDTRTYHNLGHSLSALNRFGEAAEAFQHALRIDPHHQALYNLAIALANMGQGEEAQATYERALELHPTQPGAVYNRARMHAMFANAEQALADLAQVVSRPDLRNVARTDADFDNIRSDPRFRELVGEDEPPPETEAPQD